MCGSRSGAGLHENAPRRTVAPITQFDRRASGGAAGSANETLVLRLLGLQNHQVVLAEAGLAEGEENLDE